MPRESISTPPGPPAGGRSPRPGIKKATPSLLCVWFAVMSVPLCCIRRNPASVPLLPGRRFFCRNLFPVAVLSRGDFSRRRFYAVTLRRPAAGVASAPLFLGRRFFRRNPCPVAVLSRGDFSRRRFCADAHRHPAAGIASLLPSRSRRWAGTRLAGVPATRSAGTAPPRP